MPMQRSREFFLFGAHFFPFYPVAIIASVENYPEYLYSSLKNTYGMCQL